MALADLGLSHSTNYAHGILLPGGSSGLTAAF
jgi:hypothetical protein